MLVALSGVQGSGKTTVLNGLKDLGYNVIERKTARSILADWNVKLEQVYANQELCKKFHDELLIRKEDDEHTAVQNRELCFTERSYADLFTYALVSLGHFNPYSDWLNEYYEDCKELNAKYLGVFFLDAPYSRPTENDGVRGTNKHYVRQVDGLVTDIAKRMSHTEHNDFPYQLNPLINVDRDAVDHRVRFVADQANDLWLTGRLHLDHNFYQTSTHPERIEADRLAKERSFVCMSTIKDC